MEIKPFNYRHIIWDWNGTLLDDKWLCIESISSLLASRNLPPLDNEKYDRIFRFPVREYYRAAGFDFTNEPFEVPAMEFIRLYDHRKKECRLHRGALRILELFYQMGCTQYLLSASETGILNEMAMHFGIARYFSQIRGLDNHYAHGKADLGLELVESIKAQGDSIIMIGDTCHDKEVADLLGIPAVLCSNGHFPKERLLGCGALVIRDLEELASIVLST